MGKFIKNAVLVAITGTLVLGLSACDLSKDDIEAPGVSTTEQTE